MIVVAALGAGFGVAWLLHVVLQPVLAAPALARDNYRGRPVATGAGIIAVAAVVAVEALRLGGGRLRADTVATSPARVATLLAVLGFGLFGLLDDAAGSPDRGFRGHLRMLGRGRMTTGGLKLLGGGLVAASAAAFTAPPGAAAFLADLAVIALAANLANLFDRAPGRTTKVATTCFVALALAASVPDDLAGPAVMVGAALALLGPDLGERIMLGDAGANPLGAAVGVAVVVVTTTTVATTVVAIALAALNLTSEVVSFSRIIEGLAPLRFLDRLGRAPDGG